MAQGRSRAGSAALWGVVCGLVLSALLVVSRLALAGALLRGILTPGRALLSSALALAVAATLYFVAGVLAGRRARAIEAGLFAGMIAGLIVGITALVLFAVAALRMPPGIAGGPQRPAVALARIAVARLGLDILLQIAVGAGLGALGGLLGRGGSGSGSGTPQATPPTSAPPPVSYPPFTPPPGASPPPPPIYPAPGDTAPTLPSQP